MKPIWVVVADMSRARIFSTEMASGDIKEIETLAHPESRLHEQELDSDLPGKDRGMSGAHNYEDQTLPKEKQAQEFARHIGNHLSDALNKNSYRKLHIVAAPSFLGTLRNQLSDQVRKHVESEIDKNLATHSVGDIRAHLPKSL